MKDSARVQIPFRTLRKILYVEFLIIEKNIPTLLGLRGLMKNNSYIYLMGTCLIFDGRREPFQLRNYLLSYHWVPENVQFALYTEQDLRRIHRTSGHPSVVTTINFLKRANGGNILEGAIKEVKDIATNFETYILNDTPPGD